MSLRRPRTTPVPIICLELGLRQCAQTCNLSPTDGWLYESPLFERIRLRYFLSGLIGQTAVLLQVDFLERS